ncbi:MAG: hypothetical protein GY810_05100 [Aureispira sp.]|nr:hypothetical protein [Aureispira sp.]
MKNIDNQSFTELEKLLKKGNYEALSTQEQTWLKQYLTAEQFNYSRRIVQWSQDAETVQMSSDSSTTIKNRLDTAFAAQHKAAWWSHAIPLYLAVLGMLLVAMFVWYCLPSPQEQGLEPTEVIVKQVDTVFQKQIIYRDSIVEKPVVIEKIKVVKEPVYIRDTIYAMPFAKNEKTDKATEQAKHYSLKESKELLEWMVKVD